MADLHCFCRSMGGAVISPFPRNTVCPNGPMALPGLDGSATALYPERTLKVRSGTSGNPAMLSWNERPHRNSRRVRRAFDICLAATPACGPVKCGDPRPAYLQLAADACQSTGQGWSGVRPPGQKQASWHKQPAGRMYTPVGCSLPFRRQGAALNSPTSSLWRLLIAALRRLRQQRGPTTRRYDSNQCSGRAGCIMGVADQRIPAGIRRAYRLRMRQKRC